MQQWCIPLAVVAFVSACSSAPESPAAPVAPVAATAAVAPAADQSSAQHDQTLAVAWMQQSAEYRAACLQAYGRAMAVLEQAKADPTWSACTEAPADRDASRLPPAVVLDVDETVLDNSPYAVRRLLAGLPFEATSWAAWCKEQKAAAVPGALAYTRRAAELGIRVVYVTNRRSDAGGAQPSTEESDTRQNLLRLGFPIDERDGFDCVLTRGDQGDKSARRRFVAEHFRVLQLVGDNLGDFAPGVELGRSASPQERAKEAEALAASRDGLVDARAAWWGERWILIPNPAYGSFESILAARAGSVRTALRP